MPYSPKHRAYQEDTIEEYNGDVVCVSPGVFIDVDDIRSFHEGQPSEAFKAAMVLRQQEDDEDRARRQGLWDKRDFKSAYHVLRKYRTSEPPPWDAPVVIVFKDGRVESYPIKHAPEDVTDFKSLAGRIERHMHQRRQQLKETDKG